MLSRHFLRSKVLQVLYASTTDGADVATADKRFKYHINRLNNLGTLQLAMLTQLMEVANKMFDEGTRKFRPTTEDLNPNRRFGENMFIARLADNLDFRRHCDDIHEHWEDEEDNFRRIFTAFRATDTYKAYLESPVTFEEDQAFALQAFKYVINDEQLREVVFNQSLLWEDDFDQIAQYNFMMLKALDSTFDEATPVPLMHDVRNEMDIEAFKFANNLLINSIKQREETKQLIIDHLSVGWEFDRVAFMDVMLIDMAVAELTECPSIPERVTIDEYIELAKEYSTSKSKLFINGILDKITIVLRSQGRIQKSGRGLIDPEFKYNED